MRRILSLVLLLLTASTCASETYLGLFLQGSAIGYSSYSTAEEFYDGKPVTRTDSRTRIGAGLLGRALSVKIDSTTWAGATGRPIRMSFRMESAGRVQDVMAVFGDTQVVLEVDNSGQRTQRTLSIPKDAPVVDDPLQLVLAGTVGTQRRFYILDPTTLSFVANEVKLLGAKVLTIDGKSVQTTAIQLIDPRAPTTVFVTAKGDLVRADGPMGIEMRPVSREEALKTETNPSRVDLAFATAIRSEPPLEDPAKLRRLRIEVTGRDLSRIPNDRHQSVRGSGETWVIDVNPVRLKQRPALPFEQAAAARPEWTRPGLHIPADDPAMRRLAKEIVDQQVSVTGAMNKIRAWVHGRLRSNAGIGVLRDAREVLESREGVCRDYAILTATLARAAGIPTKLVSGLVNWDGLFYYHAWVEVYDGEQWLAYDSTQSEDQVSAAHIKLAEGNVEQAFTFTFLGSVRVKVLSSSKE